MESHEESLMDESRSTDLRVPGYQSFCRELIADWKGRVRTPNPDYKCE